MKRAILNSLVSLLLVSCTSMQAQIYVPTTPAIFADEKLVEGSDKADFQKGSQLLKERKAQEALDIFGSFSSKHSSSPYLYASFLKLAESHYALAQWNQGTVVLQRLIQKSIDYEAISAQAMFLISFGYEAMGNDRSALVSLKDAERLSKHLDSLTAEIVLPARMGFMYLKLNLIPEGQAEFKKAEFALGRMKARARDGGDPALAEVFYRMSKLHTQDLSMENFQIIIDAMIQAQRYAIQAMEYESKSTWSELARQSIQSNYLDLWNFAFRPPLMAGMDPGAAARQQRDLQVRWVGALLSLIDAGRLETATVQVEINGQVARFIEFLDDMENKSKLVVYRPQDLTPLTEESLKRLSK